MTAAAWLKAARSFLFVPGDRPDRFLSALRSDADCIIVDLEDAVPTDEKGDARRHVITLLNRGKAPKPLVVRINEPRSAEGSADLTALRSAATPAAVIVPKASSPAALSHVHGRLDGQVPLLPLIESAAGVLAAPTLATAPGVVRLVLGHLDLGAELGIDPDDDSRLAPARFALVVASAAAGLPPPVDGVTTNLRDPQAAEADARRALAGGFTAKLCLHPSQVAPVHTGLSPSADELSWATSVLAAAADGVTTHENHMVDRPVLLRARSIVARATPSPVRNR